MLNRFLLASVRGSFTTLHMLPTDSEPPEHLSGLIRSAVDAPSARLTVGTGQLRIEVSEDNRAVVVVHWLEAYHRNRNTTLESRMPEKRTSSNF